WVSQNRIQEKTPPEISPVPESENRYLASFDLDGDLGVIIFPQEAEKYIGQTELQPVVIENDTDPIFYYLPVGDDRKIIFQDKTWLLE
ncbi:MAG: hypothetical protein ABIC40_04095, partial [bacterium]